MDDITDNPNKENGQAAISQASLQTPMAVTPQENVPTAHNNILSVLQIEEPAKIRSKLRTFVVLLALYLAIFIAALDITILATAIPTITETLHSAYGYVWIGGAYLLASAVSGPIWSKLSDIWGRKIILLAAVALFFVSSILCANAVNMTMLIVGRSLQGTAGGGLFQLVMIVISDLFSMRERSLYMGLSEVMWAVAGSAGPILGGSFTEKLSWRWCFWINLPITGVTFLLLLLFLDVHNPRTSVRAGLKAVDWAGSISLLAFALLFLLGLQFGGAAFPWKSPQVLCLIIFGALLTVVFVFCEKYMAKYPLMPLSIFQNRSNVACFALCALHGMVVTAGEYYLPLFFQSVRESTPLQSGILVLPIAVAEAVTGILVGILIHRTGRFLEIIYVGTVLMIIGSGLYIRFNATSTVGAIVGFQLVSGIGLGLLFEAPLIAIQATVLQDEIATATSTFGFIRTLSSSVSVVIGGVIFQSSMTIRAKTLGEAPISLPADVLDKLSDGAAAANVAVVGLINDPVQKMAVKNAFAWSLRNMWIFYATLAGLAIFSNLFIEKHHLSSLHVETKTGVKEKDETATS